MTELARLFEGMSALLWPCIIIAILLVFKPAVMALIDSAKSRKFTLKIGGQELTMEEVNAQQRVLINDLQTQVLEIQRKIGHDAEMTKTSQAPLFRSDNKKSNILWIDDEPKNNSYFVQQLIDIGSAVDQTVSTSDGFKKFNQNHYDLVISDMGRIESDGYNPTAGLDLLKEIRKKDSTTPFIIFCSRHAAKEYGANARSFGANTVTSSATELMGDIQKFLDKAID